MANNKHMDGPMVRLSCPSLQGGGISAHKSWLIWRCRPQFFQSQCTQIWRISWHCNFKKYILIMSVNGAPIVLLHCAAMYKRITNPMVWNIRLFMISAYSEKEKPAYSLTILWSSNCCRTSLHPSVKSPFSIKTYAHEAKQMLTVQWWRIDRIDVSAYQRH